jgi:branched-chain amino acid transport system permease protein
MAHQIYQAVADGILEGGVYALMAVGLTLIFGVLDIIILGGLGSIGGALAASVFMLLPESLVTIWSPNWAIVAFYAALVLVLVIRPTGFFGRKEVRAQ